MTTVVGKRCSGKTTEALKLACDTGAAIICMSAMVKQDLFEKAKRTYGKKIAENIYIFTVQDIMIGEHRGRK
ncbi:MAG: hypothetical protein NC299_18570, partial [Lachnospiraceae bacterium]|nr:hypothetical protein [Lachnospiraceae bacterium]